MPTPIDLMRYPLQQSHKKTMIFRQTILSAAITTRLFQPSSSFGSFTTISHMKPFVSAMQSLRMSSAATPVSIRNVTSDDVENLKQVIDSSYLFPSEMLDDMIAGYFAGTEDCFWLTAENDPTMIAYCAPEKMTEGTWNLYLIAVYKSKQGTGIGTKTLQYLEEQLVTKKGARILLVETSGLSEFEHTRRFYRKNSFIEEARIRDYYKEGEDKVVYWKSLVSK